MVSTRSRVLVVDDDRGMRETVAEILETAGFAAVTAATAGAAEEIVSGDHELDAAVLDHRLPDATGIELARRLKLREPDLPVLLVTGYASLETAMAAVGQLDEYLVKPVVPDQLLRAVRSAVARRRLARENRELLRQLQEVNTSLRESVLERQAELYGLISMAEAVASSSRLGRVLDATVDAVRRAVGTRTAAVYLTDQDDPERIELRAVRENGWMPPQELALPPAPVHPVVLEGDHRHACVLVLLTSSGLTTGALLLEQPRYGDDTFLRALGTLVAVGIENAQRSEMERATVERMTELNRMKSNFLANVSHELRTPLTAVLGFARTLQSRGANLSPEDQMRLLERIELQANRLHRLVEDLLDATSIENGSLRVGNAPVQVADVVDNVVHSLHEPVHRLAVEVPPDLPLVLADADRLEQVLLNLVENATKYSPVGSLITIGGAWTSRGIELWVSDQGRGIDPEFLPQLFRPFTQADADSTRRDRGVGLGLAICRGLVEAMGGSISVMSDIGAGSRFVILLPRVLPRPAESPDPQPVTGSVGMEGA